MKRGLGQGLVILTLLAACVSLGALRRRTRLAAGYGAPGASPDVRAAATPAAVEALQARLSGELGLQPERFSLELRDRVAILRGTVDWPAQIAAVETFLRGQAGVLDVVSFLRLSGSADQTAQP